MASGIGFTLPSPSILLPKRPVTSLHVTPNSSPQTSLNKTNQIPHPSLEVTGGGKDRFLPAFNSLHKPYSPFLVIAQNGHVETLFAAFFRSFPDVKYKRECIRTKDDGAVALDWVAGDVRRLPPDAPVLILLPGFTGGSQDSYVKHMLVKARSKGWRVVVFNSRSGGDSPVTTPQFYSASFIGDMREVVMHVSTRYPKANLYAVGWSLGGNILVNYLGQESENCPLTGAASLCNPFDLVIADENLRKGFNVVYDAALRNGLTRAFKKHASLFEDLDGEYNIYLGANAKTVREYDEAITRVCFGFKSVDDYYSNSSSSNQVKYVGIPLLCIQAANDPIAPAQGIPHEDIKENPNCMLIVTPQGGHLGWVAGDEAPTGAPWTDLLVMDFLEFLERGKCKSPISSGAAEDVQQVTENRTVKQLQM